MLGGDPFSGSCEDIMTFPTLVRSCKLLAAAVIVAAIGGSASAQAPDSGVGPIIVMETSKGTIEFETYPAEAPKTVAQVLKLVSKNFYTGLRFHRVVPGFVIQVGDPQTRNMMKRDQWGRGAGSGSGTPIGVAEFSKKRAHKKGAVAMAHAGDANLADSQFYVTLAPQPKLDGKYTVFGQVIAGLDVTAKIVEGDVLKKMYVKAGTPKS
jgi:peptidyl-prolyl cis-trans isomerase B (cyclophilin B)